MNVAFWTTVVAVLGTTISPYLFFWQAAQEVEDIRAVAERKPLVKKPRQGADAMQRIRIDTYVGMAFSNLIALAIIITTAATLHASGVTQVEKSSQAAEALRPLAARLHFGCLRLELSGQAFSLCPYWLDRRPMRWPKRGDGDQASGANPKMHRFFTGRWHSQS
jgi:Mn2+/Fe2+ NRAMP family transporter